MITALRSVLSFIVTGGIWRDFSLLWVGEKKMQRKIVRSYVQSGKTESDSIADSVTSSINHGGKLGMINAMVSKSGPVYSVAKRLRFLSCSCSSWRGHYRVLFVHHQPQRGLVPFVHHRALEWRGNSDEGEFQCAVHHHATMRHRICPVTVLRAEVRLGTRATSS